MRILLRQLLGRHWNKFQQTSFGCLLRVFVGRMFHGGGDATEELDLGIGVILILLAMPGILVSLLMFEKYGSLIRFLRGDGAYDPFVASIPDEYFFLVLSVVVTGAATLWRWDTIFLDRRDYTNLVSLPVSLGTIFAANFCAILILAGLFAFVVNAASLVLFPVAVVGSQSSFGVFLRFTAGHAAEVFFGSVFSFFAVFAVAGLLMAVLPASVFRRISLLARFLIGISFLLLLATVFTVPDLLEKSTAIRVERLVQLPPISFLGVARTIWGRGAEPFVAGMTHSALLALGFVILVAVVAYAVSFRRSFLRIPEIADAGPLPRVRLPFSPLSPLYKLILRVPSQRACFDFVAYTLLRSDAHLQVVLAFAALGLVAAAESLNSFQGVKSLVAAPYPTIEFLSVPFILSYCIIVGIRFAFEIPSDLRANWVFRMSLSADDGQARPIARWALLVFTLPWLAPACFTVTLIFFGWMNALVHTALLTASNVLLVEILLIKFLKIPFTCSYPTFESHSGVILAAYLFGFFLFTDYVPEMEHWSLASPFRAICFVPLFAIILAGVYAYRKQMLEMDKQLIFEETSASSF